MHHYGHVYDLVLLALPKNVANTTRRACAIEIRETLRIVKVTVFYLSMCVKFESYKSVHDMLKSLFCLHPS